MSEKTSKDTKAKELSEVFPGEEIKITPIVKGAVTEFTIKAGINKYGFIHIPKKAVPSLPFEVGKPLKAHIKGKDLTITKA